MIDESGERQKALEELCQFGDQIGMELDLSQEGFAEIETETGEHIHFYELRYAVLITFTIEFFPYVITKHIETLLKMSADSKHSSFCLRIGNIDNNIIYGISIDWSYGNMVNYNECFERLWQIRGQLLTQ